MLVGNYQPRGARTANEPLADGPQRAKASAKLAGDHSATRASIAATLHATCVDSAVLAELGPSFTSPLHYSVLACPPHLCASHPPHSPLASPGPPSSLPLARDLDHLHPSRESGLILTKYRPDLAHFGFLFQPNSQEFVSPPALPVRYRTINRGFLSHTD